ncbi:MAG: tetraacyldisaccharide 4'-kinase [Desulfobacteraceae bacterium]|nr:tetraacyldisaccharide 4'-kinase [Desulfobacteraceae bacterium]
MSSHERFPFFSLSTGLWAGSLLYGSAVRARQALYRHHWIRPVKLPCAVISVGNLTTGGTGKTPMTIYLAELAKRMGYRAVIISRGYKSKNNRSARLVSDGRSLLTDVCQAGDEPYLMAALQQGTPVVIGRRRVDAGKLAIGKFKPDILLLDDGYQHMQLHRDVNVLLMDARRPFGNCCLLPRGSLREPISALQRADAIVLTRSDAMHAQDCSKLLRLSANKPVFRAYHKSRIAGVVRPQTDCPDMISFGNNHSGGRDWLDKPLFAFSGLADNSRFWESIKLFGGKLAGTMAFDDHHCYSAKDAAVICKKARHSGAACLITTDKDYVRFAKGSRWPLPLIVMGVTIEFRQDMEHWRSFVEHQLKKVVRK